MGWSDLGCFGGEIRTPNVDNLAKRGLRFTQFYNCARCCPTRASLLTGLYPHQSGVGNMTVDQKQPGYRGQLQPNCVTLAQVLKTVGYRTYLVGKWHLTAKPGPIDRGFDEFYGMIGGFNSCFQEHPFYTRLPSGQPRLDSLSLSQRFFCALDVFSRGERAALCLPHDRRHELAADENHRSRDKLTLGFELPRGSYAMLLVKALDES